MQRGESNRMNSGAMRFEPDIEVEVSEKYKNMYASSIPKEDDSQLIKAVEAVKEKMAE